MKRKKMHLKKFNLHPITTFILLTVLVMILSSILSFLQVQVSYSRVNSVTKSLESTIVAVEGMFNVSGFQYIISNAAIYST